MKKLTCVFCFCFFPLLKHLRNYTFSNYSTVLRNYTSTAILTYRDHFSDEQKLFYRVKVYDSNENIDISHTAVVENPKNDFRVKSSGSGNGHTEDR